MSEEPEKKMTDVSLNSDPEAKESETNNVETVESKSAEEANNQPNSDTSLSEVVTSENEEQEKTEKKEKVAIEIPQTKEEIVALLETLSNQPIEDVKDSVTQLKVAFYVIRKPEIEKEKQAFLEKGNEEEAFAAMPDPLEEKLKELLKIFKEKKAERLAEVEAIKEENLKKKEEILAKLKEIVDDPDNINRYYNKFQQLQQEFRTIGEVPPENNTQLWKNYQLVTENFYDLLKINKDLRDYDFKKNLEAKEQLCKEAEELDNEADVVSAFRKLQLLHNQWREVGPVALDIREEIWNKFKGISTSINKKYQAFFEVRKEKEKENEVAKTAICEKIEAMDFTTLKTYSAWDQATVAIKDLQEEWKKLGFAAHKINVELFARFRKSCDEFFALKAEYFKTMKEEANDNLQKKIELCEKAEALKDSTDWKKTTNELVALQKEWKTVGPVSKKHSDTVWKRFITACDFFFEQKNQQTSNIRKEEHDNLAAKKALIDEANAIIEKSDAENPADKIREILKQWREIGHVPFKEKDKIYNDFQTVIKKAMDMYNIHESRARMANFESNVEQLGNDTDKLYRERDRLVRTYEQKRNELKTYENNMSFFTAKSKAGNTMQKEMERKIERIKEDVAELEKKIELIDGKIQ